MSLGSTKARNMSLDACYGDAHSSTWPATIWLHLFVSDPTQGGIELTSAGGYAPVSAANSTANFPDASGGQKTTATAMDFAASTGAWSGPADYWWFTDSQTALVAPTSPTVTPTGTSGSAAWYYVVTALNSEGETTASGIGMTAAGAAVLSATNYNALTWAAVTGASAYNVYRSTTGAAGTFNLIASPVGNSYDDTGATATAPVPPTSNTTQTLLDGGPLRVPIIVGTTPGYVVSFPAGSIVISA